MPNSPTPSTRRGRAPRRFEYLPPAQIGALRDAPKDATVVNFGTGTFAIELTGQHPDLTVIALDEQPGMLELLRIKPGAIELKNLKPVLTDRMEGLKSAILALNVLHELSDGESLRAPFLSVS